jgi:hypothetical protein
VYCEQGVSIQVGGQDQDARPDDRLKAGSLQQSCCHDHNATSDDDDDDDHDDDDDVDEDYYAAYPQLNLQLQIAVCDAAEGNIGAVSDPMAKTAASSPSNGKLKAVHDSQAATALSIVATQPVVAGAEIHNTCAPDVLTDKCSTVLRRQLGSHSELQRTCSCLKHLQVLCQGVSK